MTSNKDREDQQARLGLVIQATVLEDVPTPQLDKSPAELTAKFINQDFGNSQKSTPGIKPHG